MLIETNAIRCDAKRRRFADIVQQHSPGQRLRATILYALQKYQRMNPDISLRVILWRLLHTFKGAYLRQYFHEEPGRIEQLKAAACVAFSEHLIQFVANALTTYLINPPR